MKKRKALESANLPRQQLTARKQSWYDQPERNQKDGNFNRQGREKEMGHQGERQTRPEAEAQELRYARVREGGVPPAEGQKGNCVISAGDTVRVVRQVPISLSNRYQEPFTVLLARSNPAGYCLGCMGHRQRLLLMDAEGREFWASGWWFDETETVPEHRPGCGSWKFHARLFGAHA